MKNVKNWKYENIFADITETLRKLNNSISGKCVRVRQPSAQKYYEKWQKSGRKQIFRFLKEETVM